MTTSCTTKINFENIDINIQSVGVNQQPTIVCSVYKQYFVSRFIQKDNKTTNRYAHLLETIDDHQYVHFTSMSQNITESQHCDKATCNNSNSTSVSNYLSLLTCNNVQIEDNIQNHMPYAFIRKKYKE